MFYVREASARGQAEHGWLSSRHTFSFGDYYDPKFMGFGALRVINDDRVAAGAGFGRHPHRDMEIISYVVSGALEHKDSLGTGSVILPGDVQLMRAGTGITHSEYNHSKTEEVHFLQIWIIPDRLALSPGYEQRTFGEQRLSALRLVASNDGRDGSLTVAQDVNLFASMLRTEQSLEYVLSPTRQVWVQVVEGQLTINDLALTAGDGLAIVDEAALRFSTTNAAHFLLFDLPQPVAKDTHD